MESWVSICLQPILPHGLCMLRDSPGKETFIIPFNEEGIGYLRVAICLYGIELMPLAYKMRETFPITLQMWYTDDVSAVGMAGNKA